jgi:hypothetical protein
MPLPVPDDPLARDGSARAAGAPERAGHMAVLREQGRSLDEIALRFGVSRERVRQILRASGGPSRKDVARARRSRLEQPAEARIHELLTLWRAGAAPGSAADALGLQSAACRSVIARSATAGDRAARKASFARLRVVATTYSELDIIVALTRVATRLGRAPRAREYGRLARELGCPSLPTVVNRMGGWTNALRAADLSAPSTGRRMTARRWTVEACWTAVREVAAELEQMPSVVGYERHAADRADLPSSATVRNRLGRWSAITTQLKAERALADRA